jgi:hypothetical protein
MVREGAREGHCFRRGRLMGVLDQRRRLRSFAAQMRARKPLTDDQFNWLEQTFGRIGNGVDANTALGVKRNRGESIQDELARQRLNFTLFYIAGALNEGIEWEQALQEGVQLINRLHGHGLDPGRYVKYDVDTLKRAWNKYKDWQRPERLPGEPDSFL